MTAKLTCQENSPLIGEAYALAVKTELGETSSRFKARIHVSQEVWQLLIAASQNLRQKIEFNTCTNRYLRGIPASIIL